MINLPDVTLVTVHTCYHELARLALEDSCKEIKFAKVIVFTDKENACKFDGIADEIVEVKANTNKEATHIMWYEVSRHVKTSHFLTVQWDGWVICPELWTDDWLEYDYIGAPIWAADGAKILGEIVGNGGFSLRSKRLSDFVATHPDFPFDMEKDVSDDQTLCVKYRSKLESLGFKWADIETAERFSFEIDPLKSFGFHAIRNWPVVLTDDEYQIRKQFLDESSRRKIHLNDPAKGDNCFHQIELRMKSLTESGLGCGYVKRCTNIKRVSTLETTPDAIENMLPEFTKRSAWTDNIPFAFWLVENIKPRVFVELGVHEGVSYFAICQAVEALNLGTKCFAVDTWKGDQHAGFYNENVYDDFRQYEKRYSDFSTVIRSTFDNALNKFEDNSIDFLHIDGEHTYEIVKHDFESWLPKLTEDAIVLLHDIIIVNRSFGVWKYWGELSKKYNCLTLPHGAGLGVVSFNGRLTAPPSLEYFAVLGASI